MAVRIDKIQSFWQKWQYLLLQEKCRACGRSIHPLIDNMDFNFYRPPAKYLIQNKEIISDVLCQFCLSVLTNSQPALNIHKFEDKRGPHELCVVSGTVFEEPIKSLIHRFKYEDDVLLSKDFIYLLHAAWLFLKECMEKPDSNVTENTNLILVPVPLHKKREQKRGFNQSELLSQQLGSLLNISSETKLLRRVKNTLSQQQLNKSERAKNVEAAFSSMKADSFLGQQVILIDDVCTSGATLIECAKAVMAAGAANVFAITVAYVP